jgi:hypothetical protein
MIKYKYIIPIYIIYIIDYHYNYNKHLTDYYECLLQIKILSY